MKPMVPARTPETVPEFSRSPWPFLGLFALALVPLIHDFYIEKFFSADGAVYFQWILDDHRFTTIDWARNHATYLSQWPLVLAVRAGVTDWTTLEALFAAGLLFPHLLSFALCLVALRGLPKWPLLFPVASVLTVTLAADYILIGEHHVAAALAWPILLFALRPLPYSPWEVLLIALLLFVDARTYECSLFTGPLFALLFLARNSRVPGHRVMHGALAALSLVSAAVAAYAILHPRDVTNRGQFLQSVLMPLVNGQSLLAFAFLIPFLVMLTVGKKSGTWIAPVCMAVVAVPAAWLIPRFAFANPGSAASISFSCRTLSMTLLPALLISAAWLIRHKTQFSRASLLSFTSFVAVAVAFNLYDSRHWSEFRKLARQTLQTRHGFVPFDETPLKNHPCAWDWNNTLLSYHWSGGHVRAIILNPPGARWQPFDPHVQTILSRYISPPDFMDGASLSGDD